MTIANHSTLKPDTAEKSAQFPSFRADVRRRQAIYDHLIAACDERLQSPTHFVQGIAHLRNE
jgi:hypothetical protein